MPTCHAKIAASRSGIRAFAAMNAGPSTASAMPMVDGVSVPSGMAVTSSLPVRRASRMAITVYTRLPSSTPNAVPGNMRVNTMSAGNPKPPTRMPDSTARFTTLSSINPKKALMSPIENQRGEAIRVAS